LPLESFMCNTIPFSSLAVCFITFGTLSTLNSSNIYGSAATQADNSTVFGKVITYQHHFRPWRRKK
jgi:hypothetical protein